MIPPYILCFLAACAGHLITACSAAPPSELSPGPQCGLTPDQHETFVHIDAGSFVKGASPLYPEERPTLRLQVDGFQLQTHEVTNAQFSRFVEATAYLTDAEKGVMTGRSGAGSAVFSHTRTSSDTKPLWRLDERANWRQPEGAGSSLSGRSAHPVVHVSKQDAEAYAAWAGGRLPSEIEWEYAASLGLFDPEIATSGAYYAEQPRANTWQGMFPLVDLGRDGFTGTAPVGCYEADRAGLYDMIGNVWEWTDTPFDQVSHTLKGGSFLCADNFCRRYRPAARQSQETDFSSSHIGFRIARDLPENDTGQSK